MEKTEFEFLLQQGEGLKLKIKGISIPNKLKAEITDVARNCDPQIYIEKKANIQIDIYDDRVEISNPGGHVPAIKPHEFGKKSVTRNPLLFSLLKSVELFEKVGSGIERVRKASKKAGLPEPEFEFTSFFTIKFKRPTLEIEEKKDIQKTMEKITQKTTQKIIELIKENLY